MPESLYDLSTSDLLAVQDLIRWAKQFKYRGTVMTVTTLLRFDALIDEIDRIIVLRAAAGDAGSQVPAAEVLIRKPAGSEHHRQAGSKTGTKDK